MCQECFIATDFHEYRLFNPLCKFCGARLVQTLRGLSVSNAEKKRRQLAALADWEKYGHSRQEMLTLAKGALPLEGKQEASADPLKKRRKKSSGAAAPTGG
jgi:hypothetical protein